MMTATYSPDDNKLRLYASSRLDTETYVRVKAAGFRWAPKQDLFVAPMWTPEREDLLLELCGSIDDEDKSLTERAEERAERFDDYREHRAQDAESARQSVSAIADNIPLGQPILVGHHSERHARKDAERIENGMRRAVKMWKTAEYWKYRAAGAIRHAKYKELPGVRARRIKTIEADRRRSERNKQEAEMRLHLWTECGNEPDAALQMQVALQIANMCWLHLPRKAGDREDFAHNPTAYDALNNSHPSLYAPRTLAEVIDHATRTYPLSIATSERWIAHCDNRLTYERAMLEDQGATDLLKPKPKSAAAQLPLCNYRAPGGLDIENSYNRGEMIHYAQVEMTKAEYAAIYSDYKGTRVIGHSHRVRTAIRHHAHLCVFLTDAKVHEPPAAQEAPRREAPPARERVYVEPKADPQAATFEALAETLKAGVQVVTAPQLFPTPPELAAQVVKMADIAFGMTVLEPSAGTGALVEALPDGTPTTVVEINNALCRRLNTMPGINRVVEGDFFDQDPQELGLFDRIVMNPPFARGTDVEHILHARRFLKAGGRLVAICANGTRQQDALQPLALYWMDLPAGSFACEGTNVRTAIVILDSETSVESDDKSATINTEKEWSLT